MIRNALEGLVPAFMRNDAEAADRMLEQEAEIDYVGDEIDKYLVQVSRRNLNQEQSEFAVQLTEITTSLERIAELFKRDLHPLVRRKIEGDIPFADSGREELQAFTDLVLENYDKALLAFEEKDTEAARAVVRAKRSVADQQQAYRSMHYDGLASGDKATVAISEIHLDLVDYLRRIHSHSEAVAYTMLEGFLDKRKGARQVDQTESAAA